MKISLEWINESININYVNLDYLIQKLTIGGFEVERICKNNKQITIIEISSTANRSDSLSIFGISKELSTLLNKPYKNLKYTTTNNDWETLFKQYQKDNLITTNCQTFVAISIKNLKKINSPKWLKQRLIESSLIPNNNLLDYQNYILLETGYPFEFYDLDKIYQEINTPNFQLNLINTSYKDIVSTFKNIKLSTKNSILTINANNVPISIAGIINNKKYSYTSKTTSILIEGSIFSTSFIRQQSRLINLITNRSLRYLKNIKNNNLIISFYKLLKLIKSYNPHLCCDLHTSSFLLTESNNFIEFDYKKLNQILGPVKPIYKNIRKYVSPSIISNYLKHLKFNYKFNNRDLTWKVEIPASRKLDLTRSIDIIEEIGRLHGFKKFLTRIPIFKKVGLKDKSYKIRQKFKIYFLTIGLNELMHYSLVNNDIPDKKLIILKNPLKKDYSILRISLLPNILQTIKENLKQGNSIIQGFEFGHIFFNSENNQLKELEYLSGIFGEISKKLTWTTPSKKLTWFEGKGKIEKIFKQLNIRVSWKHRTEIIYQEILHPYKTTEIYLSTGDLLGVFGQINPVLSKNLSIPSQLFLFEFNFDKIVSEFQKNSLLTYKEYTSYPKIIKNLSFKINKFISFSQIKEFILINGTKYLKKVILLDEYNDYLISDYETSICIKLIFQSSVQNLKNIEIDHIIEKLIIFLKFKYNITMR